MSEEQADLLTPFAERLDAQRREALLGQHGRVVWFTGMSGSGKSTVAHALEDKLLHARLRATVLDGDSVRLGLCAGLDFTNAGRTENLRRVAHVAHLMADAGLIVLCAFVSPLESQRKMVRNIIGAERFSLVYMDASLALCESRDPKGLYQKARAGEIPNFTGVSSPYEVPNDAFFVDAELKTEDAVSSVITQFKLRD